ncbi:MAG TPA: hypothetical protein VKZ53_11465 [Candidatus Angelobacter sp.]|jgi:hypothetical protein|nr:hypothetical protein [Candidatus Angelobacter sp.]
MAIFLQFLAAASGQAGSFQTADDDARLSPGARGLTEAGVLRADYGRWKVGAWAEVRVRGWRRPVGLYVSHQPRALAPWRVPRAGVKQSFMQLSLGGSGRAAGLWKTFLSVALA